MKTKTPPDGFQYVTPTTAELDEWRAKHPNRRSPSTYRIECNVCHTRLWGSGLGIGSHRRSCWALHRGIPVK